jgi:cyclopropane-fatty-acyl-phospholipid synthase
MDRLLRIAFEKLIRVGNLQVSTAGGSTFTFGDGTGRLVAIRFTTRAAEGRVLIDPELSFGEAYMDGGVVVEHGSIADFLDLTVKNLNRIQPNAWSRSLRRLRSLSRRVFQGNTLWRERRNAVHHYNIDGRIEAMEKRSKQRTVR